MTSEEEKKDKNQRINRIIDGLRLLDDNLMTLVFDGNLEATQLVLNINANAAYPDTTTEIGKLMHDFRCRNAEDMYFKPLRDGVYHFKETEGGRARMSKDIENYGNERAEEGKIIGAVSTYREFHLSDQEIVTKLQEKFHLTRQEAEKYLEPAMSS